MRYLFDTANYKLTYTKESGTDTLKLGGYVDANFKLRRQSAKRVRISHRGRSDRGPGRSKPHL